MNAMGPAGPTLTERRRVINGLLSTFAFCVNSIHHLFGSHLIIIILAVAVFMMIYFVLANIPL